MTTNQRISALAVAGALLGMGCGHAAISPQLSGARAVMSEARGGSAQRLEPDEVLEAQRTLTLAEGQEDGSIAEIHYAYVAERQTRVAMADARRTMLEQGVEQDRSDYQEVLERIEPFWNVADSLCPMSPYRHLTMEQLQFYGGGIYQLVAAAKK